MNECTFSNLIGLFVMDLSVSGLDINQCESSSSPDSDKRNIIETFQNTHKCHNSSKVRPTASNKASNGITHSFSEI